ncbi:hypothetical protein [Arthrobacter monumenti]
MSAGFKVERTYGDLPLTIKGVKQQPVVHNDIGLTHSPDIDVNEWDMFVVLGMHYSFSTLAKSYTKFRRDDHGWDRSVYMVSPDVYDESVLDMFRKTKAARVMESLRAFTSKPIIYSQQPRPLEWVTHRDEPEFRHFRAIQKGGDISSLAETYEKLMHDLVDRSFHVSYQPSQTISNDVFSKTEFGLANPDDLSSDSLYTRGDFYHMNEKYGVLALRELLENNVPSVVHDSVTDSNGGASDATE